MESLSALIIEDQAEIRDGLKVLINGTLGYRCVGSFVSVEAALAEATADRPHVILLDLGLPGMSGLDGIPLLRERYPEAAIMVLTVYDDDDRIFRALCAGAGGYLLKKTPPARLLECMREAVAGGGPMSLEVAGKVISLFREFRPPERAQHNLTPHELRLLQLLAEGHNYKTAAAKLGLTIHAISFHMRHIYEKLHVHSKSEAVAKALRAGLAR